MALSPGIHGVIVIHGIGDKMKPGDILADFTSYLADALMESPAKDNGGQELFPEIRREANLSAQPPSVILQIKSPSGENATWVCKEAFWGDAFPPPRAATVLWWLLKQNLRTQIRYVWDGVAHDPANDATYMPDIRKYNEKPAWTAKKRLANKFRLKSLLAGLMIPVLAVLTGIILFFIWILQWIPSFGALDSILKWAHKLDPFLSNSLGDVQKYIEHGVWSANARVRLENVIIDMMDDRFGKVQDITIVAHSMGCVVTYDALAEGGKVAEEMSHLAAQGINKKITLVTVGSGINQVFRLARRSNLYARKQFSRSLAKEITGYGNTTIPLQDKFFWLDIYARRDPVPAGDLDPEIIAQAKVDSERQVKRRKVINKDSFILDHISYWANKEIVMPRIARAINGGTGYPWPEAGITPDKLARRTRDAARFGLLVKSAAWIVIAGGIIFVILKVMDVL